MYNFRSYLDVDIKKYCTGFSFDLIKQYNVLVSCGFFFLKKQTDDIWDQIQDLLIS